MKTSKMIYPLLLTIIILLYFNTTQMLFFIIFLIISSLIILSVLYLIYDSIKFNNDRNYRYKRMTEYVKSILNNENLDNSVLVHFVKGYWSDEWESRSIVTFIENENLNNKNLIRIETPYIDYLDEFFQVCRENNLYIEKLVKQVELHYHFRYYDDDSRLREGNRKAVVNVYSIEKQESYTIY